MNTENIRLNITLPKTLAHALTQIAGDRKRSQFIADAIRYQIQRKKKEEMEMALAEGYQANRDEGLSLSREFEGADLEGWDEY